MRGGSFYMNCRGMAGCAGLLGIIMDPITMTLLINAGVDFELLAWYEVLGFS